MNKPGNVFRFAPVLAVAFLLGSSLHAQEDVPQQGYFAVGVRTMTGNWGSSQFNEYRDIRPGFFIQGAGIHLEDLFGKKYSLDCRTRDTMLTDSEFRCAAERYGKFSLEFDWTDTPHWFTNTATTLYTESAPGVYTFPLQTRIDLTANPDLLPSILAGAHPLDMSIARKRGNGTFTYTPTAKWTLFLQYSREHEDGFRPLGTTTNDTTNTIELPEPIDYNIDLFRLGAEYALKKGAFQIGFTDSIFTNAIKTMSWDNPFQTTDAVGAGAQGRMALYPDNSAQTVDIAGAYNLTKNTRLIASITPEWMHQNDAFVPETVNSAIPDVPAVPASSLNGEKRTLAMNYTLTSRPVSSLELTTRYRVFDYTNNTPSLFFSDYAYTDSMLDGTTRQSQPYGYSSQNVSTDANWQFSKKEYLKLGYQFEKVDRQHRDVADSEENTGTAGLNLNPKKWLLFTANYKHAVRQPARYQLNMDSYPLGDNAQLPQMERFDEAARNRDQADALLQVDGGDRLTFSASFLTMQDRYPQSLYGMLNYRNTSYNADLSYQLGSNMSVFADYTLETGRSDMQGRERVSGDDSPNNDWQSRSSSIVHTAGCGFSTSGLQGKLTLDAYYNFSVAKGNIANIALGNPALADFLVTPIQDLPETSTRYHQVTVDLRYHLRNNVTPRLQYQFERFDNTDFQTSVMTPDMTSFDPTTNTSIFLGATLPAYAVHIVSASIEYRF